MDKRTDRETRPAAWRLTDMDAPVGAQDRAVGESAPVASATTVVALANDLALTTVQRRF